MFLFMIKYFFANLRGTFKAQMNGQSSCLQFDWLHMDMIIHDIADILVGSMNLLVTYSCSR